MSQSGSTGGVNWSTHVDSVNVVHELEEVKHAVLCPLGLIDRAAQGSM